MLNFNQKNNIGVGFVTELMKLSPLGKRRLRTLQPFTCGENAAFNTEMDNVRAVKFSVEKEPSRWETVRIRLKGIKDIITTAIRCKSGVVLSEPEFFEIKAFCMECRAVSAMIVRLAADCGIKGIQFADLSPVIELLDPSASGSASFEISSLYSQELADIRTDKRATELELRQSPDDEQLKAMRTRLVSMERTIELEILADLSRKASVYADDIVSCSLMLGYADLLIEKGVLAAEWGLVRPTLSNKISFENVYNPMIAASLEEKGKSFTPISIEIGQGCTVISGANMSGKSVALKTVALNLYLVSTGFFPFAEKAETLLFDDMITLSEDLEDSARGLSSFGGEIVRLNECISAVKEGFTVLFMDEFARGTNPAEGTKIARATARYFGESECVCVMTTHFDTVADVAGAHYQVKGLSDVDDRTCMDVADIASLMDYSLVKVTPDKPVSKDAVRVCRLLGLDEELLQLIEEQE